MAKLMNEIIHDMSFADYLAAEGVSQSQLKNLAKCPAYYKYAQENHKDTDAMRFGRMLHEYVLEPKEFSKKNHIVKKVAGKGKVWIEKKSLEVGKNILLKDEEFATLRAMKKSINNHQSSSQFMTNTINESSMFWSQEVNNTIVNCKGRIDAIKYNGDKVALVDLKTTKDAERSVFERDMIKYKYHMQAAYYMDGFERVMNKAPDCFVFIAIEKTAPYLVSINPISFGSRTHEIGQDEYLEQLTRYVNCNDNNKWDAGYDDISDVQLPLWYIKQREVNHETRIR